MKTIFKSPNVFPPYDYQDLINHKNKYYDYLEKNDINVLPFVYISSREIKNNLKGCLKKIGKLKPGNDGKFIGKPIYGQESIDYKEFDENTKPYIIIKYLEKFDFIYWMYFSTISTWIIIKLENIVFFLLVIKLFIVSEQSRLEKNLLIQE